MIGAVALFCAVVAGAIEMQPVDDEARRVGIVECADQQGGEHNPGLAAVTDRLVCFQAFAVNFDLGDDDDGDGKPDVLAVPHWVSQRVDRKSREPRGGPRPRAWYTIPDLARNNIAPTDDSYKFSKSFRDAHPNWYDRGHMAQKFLAERLGPDAGKFTHNVGNAVPQRSRFNSGPWLKLECYTGALANRHGSIWVVSGPVFLQGRPTHWLREPGRKALKVAIPDALFKIVARKDETGAWDALAFVYPQDHPSYRKGPFRPSAWLASVARIEHLTGQRFFTDAGGDTANLKKRVATAAWPVAPADYDQGCKKFAKEGL